MGRLRGTGFSLSSTQINLIVILSEAKDLSFLVLISDF